MSRISDLVYKRKCDACGELFVVRDANKTGVDESERKFVVDRGARLRVVQQLGQCCSHVYWESECCNNWHSVRQEDIVARDVVGKPDETLLGKAGSEQRRPGTMPGVGDMWKSDAELKREISSQFPRIRFARGFPVTCQSCQTGHWVWQ